MKYYVTTKQNKFKETNVRYVLIYFSYDQNLINFHTIPKKLNLSFFDQYRTF